MRSLILFLFLNNLLNLEAQKYLQLGKSDVYDFRFSPQGSLVYLSSGKSITIWNVAKESQIGSLEDGPVKSIISMDVTNDSAFLVASSLDSTIVVWNLTNFTLLKRVKLNSIANCVVFSDNSNILAGLRNGELLSINGFTGNISLQKKVGNIELNTIAVMESNGLLAISGSDGKIRLWNSKSFTEYDQKKTHANFIRGLVFSKGGKRLYSCGDDGRVLCYNILSNRIEKDFDVYKGFKRPWIMSLDYFDPGYVAYVNVRGGVYIDNTMTSYSYQISGKIYKVRFRPVKDGQLIVGLATNDGVKILWASKMNSKY